MINRKILKLITLTGIFHGMISISLATVLFSDGFEDAPVGETVKFAQPISGNYILNTSQPKSMIIVRGSVPDGPSAAFHGENYLAMTRSNDLGYYPSLSAMFDGGEISPATQSFTVSFAIWSTSGFASFHLSNEAEFTASHHLLVNAIDVPSRQYKAFNGDIYMHLANIEPEQWNKITIHWDATTKEASVSINDEQSFLSPLFEDIPDTVDRILFRTGADETRYWLDEIKVETDPQ